MTTPATLIAELKTRDLDELYTQLNNGGFGEPFGPEDCDALDVALADERATLVQDGSAVLGGVSIATRGDEVLLVAESGDGFWAVEVDVEVLGE